MINGFLRVGAVVPKLKVANINGNVEEIKCLIEKCLNYGIKIAVFPELSISGYSCGDMFLNADLQKNTLKAINELCSFCKDKNCVVVVGASLANCGQLFNCAVVIYGGKVLGIVPKTFLPNYNEFYEKRWFCSAKDAKNNFINLFGEDIPFGNDLVFKLNDEICFGVELCEDLWVVTPPSDNLALNGANIILNLSASNEVVGKAEYRRSLIKMQSAKTLSAYVYCSCGVNETTTDVVFGGYSAICESGSMLSESERFHFESSITYNDIDYEFLNSERLSNKSFADCAPSFKAREIYIENNLFNDKEINLTAKNAKKSEFGEQNQKRKNINNLNQLIRNYKKLPFVPNENEKIKRCEEIINMQSCALAKRMKSAFTEKLVIGVSGGLDSTLALLICYKAMRTLGLNPSNVIAVTMPGYGTTGRTYQNALKLIDCLGVSKKEINIKNACEQHLKDIGLNEFNKSNIYESLTFENAQARERTQILFDIANLHNALVVGTGDLSELALGWCTYNGDHMSSYAVNSGVPKTLVKYLVEYVAVKNVNNVNLYEVLTDIIQTPISPELLPSENDKITQVTEDVVGSYVINDFILYHFLRRKSKKTKIKLLLCHTFGLSGGEAIDAINSFYKRFFANQFKRSCLPDGVKIGSVSLSPRCDLRLPSDVAGNLWKDELI